MHQGNMFSSEPNLSLRDYLDATDHAASRSRASMIVLIVACMLVLAGLVNSLQHSWMSARLHALRSPSGDYAVSKIGPAVSLENYREWGSESVEEARQVRNEQYLRLYSEVAEVYAKNSFTIGIPVLGASVDVNDLGILGGVALLCVIVVCTFYLSRELQNLRVAFSAARRGDQVREFYEILAMKQVFTIPPTPEHPRPWYQFFVPEGLYVLPPLVHGAVCVHDYLTAAIGRQLSDTHTQLVLTAEFAVWLLIAMFSGAAWVRQKRLDAQWDKQFKEAGLGGAKQETPAHD